jgi:hypothetical protein
MAPMSHLLDEVGQRESARLNSSVRYDGPDAIKLPAQSVSEWDVPRSRHAH